MAENSSIGWLQRDGVNGATWNPWISCAHATYIGSDGKEHVHPGCLHCYAENLMDTRYGKCQWGSNGNRVVTAPDYWRKPDVWNRKARSRYRMPVFPSLCDPFEDWRGPMVVADGRRLGINDAGKRQPFTEPSDHGESLWGNLRRWATMDDIRFDMFMQIDHTENLDWLLFTKRPQNVMRMWPLPISEADSNNARRDNVTICYSASNQETLNYGGPLVYRCADLCHATGVSLEPFLGPVIFPFGTIRHDWVIVGCESNGNQVGRLGEFKTERQWWDAAADVVRQCAVAGVPCFLKQGPKNGRIVTEPADFPAECRVREFPAHVAGRS